VANFPINVANVALRAKYQHYPPTVLASQPVLPDTERIVYEHARLWTELESSGKRIGAYDLSVAATAGERGSDVAKFNRRHVAHAKGLTVIEPQQSGPETRLCLAAFIND
jgi:predicted nucleic acid-binding protein